MLVLTRTTSEAIMIGENIEITIVGIKGDKVRIGIRAPNTVPVHRKEVYLAIKQANIEAAKTAPASPQTLSDIEHLMNRPPREGGPERGSQDSGSTGPTLGPGR